MTSSKTNIQNPEDIKEVLQVDNINKLGELLVEYNKNIIEFNKLSKSLIEQKEEIDKILNIIKQKVGDNEN